MDSNTNLGGKYFKWFITLVSISMAAFHLYTAGIEILTPLVQRSIHLAFGFTLIFLCKPLKLKGSLKYVNYVFALLGVIVSLYITFNYKAIAKPMRIAYPTTMDVVLGVLAVLLVLEATRRTIGWVMPFLATLFIIYGFVAPYVPGALKGPGMTLQEFVAQGYLYVHGIFGTPLGVSATVVVMFIIFGSIFSACGAGDLFTDLSYAVFGRLRGGPAKMAVISSALFGTISGSSVANVATTGSFTIPLMKRVGYDANFAGATEAAASIGGQIMPPVMGAAAFVMAEALGVPYLTIVKIAVIPAILYFTAIFMSVDFYACKKNLRGLSKEELPSLTEVMKKSGVLILPLVLLIYLFVIMRWSPTRSVFWAILLSIAVGFTRPEKRKSLDWILEGFVDGAKGSLVPLSACSTAGLIILIVQITGLGVKISNLLTALAGGHLILLLFLTMVVSIIMGMGLPTVAAYIVVGITAAPAIIMLGVDPLAAHLFVFYFCIMSSITPPVALSAYTGAGIAGGDPTKTGFMALRIVFPAFVLAYSFAIDNSILLINTTTWQVIYQIVINIIGIMAICTANHGCLFYKYVPKPIRGLYLIGGVLVIWPTIFTDKIGFGLLAMGLLLTFFRNIVPKQLQEKL